MKIRATILSRRHRTVYVDHSKLEVLSPACALVLTAELFHASQFAPDVVMMGNMPAESGVRDLLGLIGYYKYFPGTNWSKPTTQTRFYLEHCSGAGTDRDAVRTLIAHLRTTGKLLTSLFYEALIEGMQNAAEWGYQSRQKGYRLWWLLGYRDSTTGEIAYCFYDQGVGIPVSIRTRLLDRVVILRPRGSQLIRKAVVTGHYSSTRKRSRGRGLPTLKRFIDGGTAGELLIHSRESQCIFRTAKPVETHDFKAVLRGTLISWTFTA